MTEEQKKAFDLAEKYATERFVEEFGEGATIRYGGARHHWWWNQRDKKLRELGFAYLIPG